MESKPPHKGATGNGSKLVNNTSLIQRSGLEFDRSSGQYATTIQSMLSQSCASQPHQVLSNPSLMQVNNFGHVTRFNPGNNAMLSAATSSRENVSMPQFRPQMVASSQVHTFTPSSPTVQDLSSVNQSYQDLSYQFSQLPAPGIPPKSKRALHLILPAPNAPSIVNQNSESQSHQALPNPYPKHDNSFGYVTMSNPGQPNHNAPNGFPSSQFTIDNSHGNAGTLGIIFAQANTLKPQSWPHVVARSQGHVLTPSSSTVQVLSDDLGNLQNSVAYKTVCDQRTTGDTPGFNSLQADVPETERASNFQSFTKSSTKLSLNSRVRDIDSVRLTFVSDTRGHNCTSNMNTTNLKQFNASTAQRTKVMCSTNESAENLTHCSNGLVESRVVACTDSPSLTSQTMGLATLPVSSLAHFHKGVVDESQKNITLPTSQCAGSDGSVSISSEGLHNLPVSAEVHSMVNSHAQLEKENVIDVDEEDVEDCLLTSVDLSNFVRPYGRKIHNQHIIIESDEEESSQNISRAASGKQKNNMHNAMVVTEGCSKSPLPETLATHNVDKTFEMTCEADDESASVEYDKDLDVRVYIDKDFAQSSPYERESSAVANSGPSPAKNLLLQMVLNNCETPLSTINNIEERGMDIQQEIATHQSRASSPCQRESEIQNKAHEVEEQDDSVIEIKQPLSPINMDNSFAFDVKSTDRLFVEVKQESVQRLNVDLDAVADNGKACVEQSFPPKPLDDSIADDAICKDEAEIEVDRDVPAMSDEDTDFVDIETANVHPQKAENTVTISSVSEPPAQEEKVSANKNTKCLKCKRVFTTHHQLKDHLLCSPSCKTYNLKQQSMQSPTLNVYKEHDSSKCLACSNIFVNAEAKFLHISQSSKCFSGYSNFCMSCNKPVTVADAEHHLQHSESCKKMYATEFSQTESEQKVLPQLNINELLASTGLDSLNTPTTSTVRCDSCSTWFTSYARFKIHIRLSTECKDFYDKCNASKTATEMEPVGRPSNNETTKPTILCPVCGRKFATNAALTIHINQNAHCRSKFLHSKTHKVASRKKPYKQSSVDDLNKMSHKSSGKNALKAALMSTCHSNKEKETISHQTNDMKASTGTSRSDLKEVTIRLVQMSVMCSSCHSPFFDQTALSKHQTSSIDCQKPLYNTIFQCGGCKRTFDGDKSLAQHLQKSILCQTLIDSIATSYKENNDSSHANETRVKAVPKARQNGTSCVSCKRHFPGDEDLAWHIQESRYCQSQMDRQMPKKISTNAFGKAKVNKNLQRPQHNCKLNIYDIDKPGVEDRPPEIIKSFEDKNIQPNESTSSLLGSKRADTFEFEFFEISDGFDQNQPGSESSSSSTSSSDEEDHEIKCAACSQTFTDKLFYKHHLKVNKSEPYHARVSHSQQTIKCGACKRKLKSDKALQAHLLKSSICFLKVTKEHWYSKPGEALSCKICKKSLPAMKDLAKHCFKNMICRLSYIDAVLRKFSPPMRDKAPSRLANTEAVSCGEVSSSGLVESSSQLAEASIDVSSPVLSFKCNCCSVAFHSRNQFQLHFFNNKPYCLEHYASLGSQQQAQVPYCFRCKSRFDTIHKARMHKCVGLRRYVHACGICHFKFPTLVDFKIHKETHPFHAEPANRYRAELKEKDEDQQPKGIEANTRKSVDCQRTHAEKREGLESHINPVVTKKKNSVAKKSTSVYSVASEKKNSVARKSTVVSKQKDSLARKSTPVFPVVSKQKNVARKSTSTLSKSCDKLNEGKCPSENIACILCLSKFATFPQLLEHSYVHTEEKQYKCSRCGFICSHYNRLVSHEIVHKRLDKVGQTSRPDLPSTIDCENMDKEVKRTINQIKYENEIENESEGEGLGNDLGHSLEASDDEQVHYRLPELERCPTSLVKTEAVNAKSTPKSKCIGISKTAVRKKYVVPSVKFVTKVEKSGKRSLVATRVSQVPGEDHLFCCSCNCFLKSKEDVQRHATFERHILISRRTYQRAVWTPGKFACKICKTRYSRKSTLQKHMPKHNEGSSRLLKYLSQIKMPSSDSGDKQAQFTCNLCKEQVSTGKTRHFNNHLMDLKEKVKKKSTRLSWIPSKEKCKVCKKVFCSRKMLLRHLSSHKERDIFTFGRAALKPEQNVLEGIQRNGEQLIYRGKCNLCHKKFCSVWDYKCHFRLIHQTQSKYRNKSGMQYFMKFTGDRPSMTECPKSLKSPKTSLSSAKAVSVDKISIGRCRLCPKKLETMQDLRHHLTVAHNKPGYTLKHPGIFLWKELAVRQSKENFSCKCKVCSSVFYRWKSFSNHVRKVHADLLPDMSSYFERKNGTIVCKDCEKVFHIERNAKIHVALAHPKKNVNMKKIRALCSITTMSKNQLEHIFKRSKSTSQKSTKDIQRCSSRDGREITGPSEEMKTSNQDIDTINVCQLCRAVFKDHVKYFEHLKSHLKSCTINLKGKCRVSLSVIDNSKGQPTAKAMEDSKKCMEMTGANIGRENSGLNADSKGITKMKEQLKCQCRDDDFPVDKEAGDGVKEIDTVNTRHQQGVYDVAVITGSLSSDYFIGKRDASQVISKSAMFQLGHIQSCEPPLTRCHCQSDEQVEKSPQQTTHDKVMVCLSGRKEVNEPHRDVHESVEKSIVPHIIERNLSDILPDCPEDTSRVKPGILIAESPCEIEPEMEESIVKPSEENDFKQKDCSDVTIASTNQGVKSYVDVDSKEMKLSKEMPTGMGVAGSKCIKEKSAQVRISEGAEDQHGDINTWMKKWTTNRISQEAELAVGNSDKRKEESESCANDSFHLKSVAEEPRDILKRKRKASADCEISLSPLEKKSRIDSNEKDLPDSTGDIIHGKDSVPKSKKHEESIFNRIDVFVSKWSLSKYNNKEASYSGDMPFPGKSSESGEDICEDSRPTAKEQLVGDTSESQKQLQGNACYSEEDSLTQHVQSKDTDHGSITDTSSCEASGSDPKSTMKDPSEEQSWGTKPQASQCKEPESSCSEETSSADVAMWTSNDEAIEGAEDNRPSSSSGLLTSTAKDFTLVQIKKEVPDFSPGRNLFKFFNEEIDLTQDNDSVQETPFIFDSSTITSGPDSSQPGASGNEMSSVGPVEDSSVSAKSYDLNTIAHQQQTTADNISVPTNKDSLQSETDKETRNVFDLLTR